MGIYIIFARSLIEVKVKMVNTYGKNQTETFLKDNHKFLTVKEVPDVIHGYSLTIHKDGILVTLDVRSFEVAKPMVQE